MNTRILLLCVAALALPASVPAEVNVNVNVGVPAPRVVVGPPPAVLFERPPLFLAPPSLGFYVGVDGPHDIVFVSNYYYLRYGNGWYRSTHYNGPWRTVRYERLPPGIRKHRLGQIRSYRDVEYRTYERERDHYRGRHFRPDKEWRERRKTERGRGKEELKEQRREEKRHDRRGRHDD